jgi:hypothetical protein
MNEYSRAASPPPGEGSPDVQADSLPLAVRSLLLGLRAGLADVVDLVAAEANVAIRMLVAMVVSAVGAVVLGIFALAGVAIAAASELIVHGVPIAVAIGAVTLLCAVGCVVLVIQLRRLARQALFGHSREHLRGHH